MELDRSFRAEYAGVTEIRDRPFEGCELREAPDGSGGTTLTFTGYASVVDSPYAMSDFMGDYTETISRSAFDRTLAEAPDVNFLMNHEGVSLARTKAGTLKLSADDKGLHSEARFDPKRPDVLILRSAIENGAVDEMSFAFRVSSQEWNEDYDERNITSVNLHHGDVSAVNFGANPHTAGSVGLRSLRFLERELRAGTLPPEAVATLRASLPDLSAPVVEEEEVIPEAPARAFPLDLYKARAYSLRTRAA